MTNTIDGRGAGRGNGEGKRNEVNVDLRIWLTKQELWS